MNRPRPSRLGVTLLALVAIGGLVARLTLISGSMPYPGHIDEPEISVRAARILETGDWNPHFFEYPSLPIYLAAAGFTGGFLHGCAERKLHDVSQIGSVSFPSYDQPVVVYPARALYALLSTLALIFAGLVAYRLSGIDALLWLAPAVLSVSTEYLYLSWKYLNVDIVGGFFVAATLLHLTWNWEDYASPAKSVVAGALAGLAISSKYSLYPILLPGLLTILLAARERRALHTVSLALASGAAFLLTTPYALLDFGTFLNGVGGAIHHYAGGHPGFSAGPGQQQLRYYTGHLFREFGWLAVPLAIVGAGRILTENPGRGLMFLSFPTAHLAYMSMQRAHFLRHIVAEYLCFAILVATGLAVVIPAAAAALQRAPSFRGRDSARSAAAAALVTALFVLSLPLRNLAAAYDFTPDSRTLAVRWLKRHLPEGARIVVPTELELRAAQLQGKFQVVSIEVHKLAPGALAGEAGSYVLLPTFAYDERSPRWSASAAAANRVVAGLSARVLAEFGTRPVLLHYAVPVAGGDPSIRIAQLPGGEGVAARPAPESP